MSDFLGFEKRKKDILKPHGYRQSVSALVLTTLAINVLSLALPVMTLQVYDRILPNPGTGTLPVLITGVCLAVFLESVLRLCRAYVLGRAGAAYEHRMSCGAMDKVLHADLSKMDACGIGEHLQRMAAIGKLKDFYNGYALTVLLELGFVVLFLGLIAYIAHVLVLVPVTILTVFVMISVWKGNRIRKALRRREKADSERFNFLIESLEGIHTLKSFAAEKFFERRYEALEEKSTRENFRVTQVTADTFNTGSIFSHLMVACVISSGAWLVLNGMLTTGALIATLLLSGRIMQPVQKALSLWARYQDFLLAQTHALRLFRTPQQQWGQQESTSGLQPVGNLRLENIGFRYGGEERAIIKGVNLDLSHGEVAFIGGDHGAGKTTLLNLISGIYPPGAGSVIIDGRNLRDYDHREIASHVGYVRTQPLIFRGTIRDNITCFGKTTERQAREIAAMLEVDRDVAKLPGGFDTFLNGNNTDCIPQGLRQRIAIVRALAVKPRLILFDNADRSLDRDGYALVYSMLARLKGRTSMVLVTDDRNIAALSDRQYRLENRRLVETEEKTCRGNIRPYRELPL